MLNFRLKAVVGWARPNGNLTHFGNYSKKHLLNAISDSYVTLNLTPTIHEFNIDDQGRVTFVGNYLAYIDDFFDQPNFNIFSDIETGKKILSRQIKYKFLGKHCENEELATLKEKEMPDVEKDKDASLQVIMKKILTKGRMKYINISRDQLLAFTSKGPFFEMPMEVNIWTVSCMRSSTSSSSSISRAHEAEDSVAKYWRSSAGAILHNFPLPYSTAYEGWYKTSLDQQKHKRPNKNPKP